MKIILIGACGKMGMEIWKEASKRGIEIVGVDEKNALVPFPLYKTLPECAAQKADVAIDFSSPRKIEERIAYCVEKKLPLVVGCTGLSDDQIQKIKEASEKIPTIVSSNFSIPVLLLKRFTKVASETLENFDVCILEQHAKTKRDAPSGTALMLKDACKIKTDLLICSLRMGDCPGRHSVIFAGEGEELTLSHAATTRAVFARGALACASWLITRPPALYPAEDALLCQT